MAMKRQLMMPVSRADLILTNARLVNQNRGFEEDSMEPIIRKKPCGVRRHLFDRENYITSFTTSIPVCRKQVSSLVGKFFVNPKLSLIRPGHCFIVLVISGQNMRDFLSE